MAVELEAGRAARTAVLNKDEAASVKGLGLLTLKPMIYCANVAEGDLADQGASNHHVKVGAALGRCPSRSPARVCKCAPRKGLNGVQNSGILGTPLILPLPLPLLVIVLMPA